MNDILGVLGFQVKQRSSRPLSSFPPLPIELVRYIMELAAEDHSAALRLTLVSKPVHVWIAPLLYCTVTLRTSGQVRAFHDHLAMQSTSSKVVLQVKNLFIRCLCNPSMHSLTYVLSTCTQVDRLVLDSLHRQPLDLNLPWPAPWEVIFMYGASSWLLKGHPILRNVTHLHLDDVLFESTLDACKHFCPRLTHIGITHRHTNNNAVSGDNFVRLIRWLLSSTPSLEMVLLHSIGAGVEPITSSPDFSDRVWHELSNIEDERLLARAGLEDKEYSMMLRTGKSVWDDAKMKFGDWRWLV